MDLTANEREPGAELAKGVDDALDQPILELSLGGVPVDGEELERERILGDLLSEFGIGALQGVREVGRGRTLSEVQLGLDLVSQYGTTPTMGDVLGAVPIAQLGIIELLEQLDHLAPGQLANGSVTDCIVVWPRLGERQWNLAHWRSVWKPSR